MCPRAEEDDRASLIRGFAHSASSSNEGDLVLDAFCGGGTTLATADALGRRWIGIDQSRPAIEVSAHRLEEAEFRLWRGPELAKAA